MPLDRDDVAKIAHLARLELGDDESDRVLEQLSRILAFVDQLDDVDTAGVEPLAHPLDVTQPLRADEVTESDRRERFQRIAPAVEDGLYLVPRVID